MTRHTLDPRDALLLKAATLSDDEAVKSWNDWSAEADIDGLWDADAGLFPLVYKNLADRGESVSNLPVLKKRYTTAWLQNEVLLRKSAEALSILESSGIEAMLLKGLAMTVGYYLDSGVRPMGDVDILVAPGRVADATDALRAAGFSASPEPTSAIVRYHHSTHLDREDGFTVDLHWRPVWEVGSRRSIDHVWAGAVDAEVGGTRVLIPNPADQLLLSSVHAGRSPREPIRYMADAAWLVLRHAAAIDWDRLADAARRFRLVVPVRRTLTALDSAIGRIPSGVLDQLERSRLSQTERIQLRFERSDPGRSLFGKAPKMLVSFLRLTEDDGVLQRLVAVPSFLAYTWDLDEHAGISSAALSKAGLRAKRALRLEKNRSAGSG